jgi:hypothetical protein
MPVCRLAALCGALMCATHACGTSLSRSSSSAASPPLTEVSVEIENHNWSDITIYLMTGGLPQRLGMVTALGNASFAFPSQQLSTGANVRLRALPVAGQAHTSDAILVQPGQAIIWTLENDLDISSLSVY